jgi:hypothetical protein
MEPSTEFEDGHGHEYEYEHVGRVRVRVRVRRRNRARARPRARTRTSCSYSLDVLVLVLVPVHVLELRARRFPLFAPFRALPIAIGPCAAQQRWPGCAVRRSRAPRARLILRESAAAGARDRTAGCTAHGCGARCAPETHEPHFQCPRPRRTPVPQRPPSTTTARRATSGRGFGTHAKTPGRGFGRETQATKLGAVCAPSQISLRRERRDASARCSRTR